MFDLKFIYKNAVTIFIISAIFTLIYFIVFNLKMCIFSKFLLIFCLFVLFKGYLIYCKNSKSAQLKCNKEPSNNSISQKTKDLFKSLSKNMESDLINDDESFDDESSLDECDLHSEASDESDLLTSEEETSEEDMTVDSVVNNIMNIINSTDQLKVIEPNQKVTEFVDQIKVIEPNQKVTEFVDQLKLVEPNQKVTEFVDQLKLVEPNQKVTEFVDQLKLVEPNQIKLVEPSQKLVEFIDQIDQMKAVELKGNDHVEVVDDLVDDSVEVVIGHLEIVNDQLKIVEDQLKVVEDDKLEEINKDYEDKIKEEINILETILTKSSQRPKKRIKK